MSILSLNLPSAALSNLCAVPARTLATAVHFDGVGLFCPVQCAVTVRPRGAGEGTGQGIFFRRVDSDGQFISATVGNLLARPRHTVLGRPDGAANQTVQTVEHLMSALAALGVSDALVEVRGPEVPLTDGSAGVFARAIVQAGVVEIAGQTVAPLVVKERIEVSDGGAMVVAEPLHEARGVPTLAAAFNLDYGPGAPLPRQSAAFNVDFATPDVAAYLREIATARTFCTVQEAHAMRAAGMFTHLTPADVPVIGPNGPVEGTLRFSDEPARHKVLDLIGDLALAGRPIHARVTATRSGHALNHRMATAILERCGGTR